MIQLTVNGSVKQYDGDPAMPVLWYLRDLLELTGAKFGCGMGLCGACTVHVEGKATRSCVTNLSDVAGKRITTIEGLDPKGDHPLQKAWRAVNVPQCGYCPVSYTHLRGRSFQGKEDPAEHQRSGRENAAHEIPAADYSDRIALHTFTPAAIFTACRMR